MLTPAALWRRARRGLRERDPEHDAFRRAIRAAIVLPIAAFVGFAVGSGSQTPLFAIFGSVALLITVDFPGSRPARALAYGGLGVNGAILITLGSLVAPIPWLAVTMMFVLGVAVTFSGVLSEFMAAGQRSTLLTFVLPVCTPPGPIPERLLGWVIALALAVPAALFLLPPRHHDELRQHAAQVCRTLADRLEGHASADDVATAMGALRANFLGADFRPVGLTAGSRALVRVVDDLQWLADRVTDTTGELLAEMRDPSCTCCASCAERARHRRAPSRATAPGGARRRPGVAARRGAEPLPRRHRRDPRRGQRRLRDRDGAKAADPPHDIGLRRRHRTHHRHRRRGRRQPGVGARARPWPADVRRSRPDPVGVARRSRR